MGPPMFVETSNAKEKSVAGISRKKC